MKHIALRFLGEIGFELGEIHAFSLNAERSSIYHSCFFTSWSLTGVFSVGC